MTDYVTTYFTWHRFFAIQIWILVLLLLYTFITDLNMLFGDGELYRILFTWRSTDLNLMRRQRIRTLTKLSHLIAAHTPARQVARPGSAGACGDAHAAPRVGDAGGTRVPRAERARAGHFVMTCNETRAVVWEWTTDWYAARHPAAADKPCCVPANPLGAPINASYDPHQPAIPIPRKVVKGGSFLCAPSYCRRYRPAARQPQMIDSAMSHIGFRCIAIGQIVAGCGCVLRQRLRMAASCRSADSEIRSATGRRFRRVPRRSAGRE